MPLFDFFKKSPKKEDPKTTSSDNPFASPELQKKRYEAAMEFVNLFRDKTPLVNGRPHAGTIMAAAAYLAGTSLFRAINKRDVAPGIVVLSEEVNTAYPQLLNLFAYYCKQNGVDVMAQPLITEFPEEDKPLMELSQIQAVYQDEYHAIMKKHGLDFLEGARAGMIICSVFFEDLCNTDKLIDPYVATGIVAMGVVEGAKTGPVRLKSKRESAPESPQEDQAAELLQTVGSASISGSGARLVVGGGMAPFKEAEANGGKYVLAHPEVLNQLEQAGLDPFMVYEAALRIQLELKIPRVDVVNANVEKLSQEWGGKSQKKAPAYVRQLLWLKANAEKYGYEQSANGWVLKE